LVRQSPLLAIRIVSCWRNVEFGPSAGSRATF